MSQIRKRVVRQVVRKGRKVREQIVNTYRRYEHFQTSMRLNLLPMLPISRDSLDLEL